MYLPEIYCTVEVNIRSRVPMLIFYWKFCVDFYSNWKEKTEKDTKCKIDQNQKYYVLLSLKPWWRKYFLRKGWFWKEYFRAVMKKCRFLFQLSTLTFDNPEKRMEHKILNPSGPIFLPSKFWIASKWEKFYFVKNNSWKVFG